MLLAPPRSRGNRSGGRRDALHLDRWSGGFANGEVPKTLAAQGTAFSLELRPPTRGIQQSQVLGTAPSIRRSHPRMAAITGRATDPGFFCDNAVLSFLLCSCNPRGIQTTKCNTYRQQIGTPSSNLIFFSSNMTQKVKILCEGIRFDNYKMERS